ncbi:MAG: pantoate--beta-alanine ligase [Deltaproteobacteria bacterium]|nr:pantoate--beta-alanine ligase [Deltaproteobacteria bacterium]
MQQLSDPAELRRSCDDLRRRGQRIGFVPTMGYLHEGHLSLVRLARERADAVVVSVFVNPTQFGPSEDLARYPRDLSGDADKCSAAGVDLFFVPDVAAVYPEGHQTFVSVGALAEPLCGARRPGHFRGVCTVVTQLLNMVGPCAMVLGEKDYQQLQVLRRMVRDLHLPAEVIGGPIVREPDGLALSSRNVYLKPEERRAATALSRALFTTRERARGRGMTASEALELARGILAAEPLVRLDYLEARDPESLEPADVVAEGKAVLLVAAFLGATRLIDNVRV